MKRRPSPPHPAPPQGPHGFGRCACGQWGIVLVNREPLCGACLPDALARARREYAELRRQLAEFFRR